MFIRILSLIVLLVGSVLLSGCTSSGSVGETDKKSFFSRGLSGDLSQDTLPATSSGFSSEVSSADNSESSGIDEIHSLLQDLGKDN